MALHVSDGFDINESLCFAATLQSVLILLFAVVNATITSATTGTDKVLFPYSILLSGLGTLLSIVAWVICVIVYNNERNRESENQRHRMDQSDPLPLSELLYSHMKQIDETNK